MDAIDFARKQASGMQRRVFVPGADDGVELRAGKPNADGSIPFKGYAARFGQQAEIAGMFREQFSAGSFSKTIAEADVRMLVNHDSAMPLARTKSGTLRLSEDKRGLVVEADMAPTSYAVDLAISLERRDVSQMSIGFISVKEDWDERGKMPLRTITEARLFDVSPVTFPAYEGTDASLRSMQLTALYEVLGIDDLAVDERDTLILQVHNGDVPPEHLPILRSMQERIAAIMERAAPALAPVVIEPVVDHSGSIDIYRKRLHLAAIRYAINA